VKQQPVLANFPSHVFATGRRRFQAGMRRLRESLAGESLSGYSVMFADVLPAAFLKRIDPTKRNRHFGHINGVSPHGFTFRLPFHPEAARKAAWPGP
jgi:hypothetical protein